MTQPKGGAVPPTFTPCIWARKMTACAFAQRLAENEKESYHLDEPDRTREKGKVFQSSFQAI